MGFDNNSKLKTQNSKLIPALPKYWSDARRIVGHDAGGADIQQTAGLGGVVDHPVVSANPEGPALFEKPPSIEPDGPGVGRDLGGVACDEAPRERCRQEPEQCHLRPGEGGAAAVAEVTDAADYANAEARQGHPVLRTVPCQQLEQIGNRSGVTGFVVDAHGHARESLENLVERGHGVVVEVASVGGRKIPHFYCGEAKRSNVLGNTGQTLTVGVVRHHEVAVGGAVDVQLECIGAVSQSLLEGLESVLGQVGRGAAVGVETEVEGGLRHAGSWYPEPAGKVPVMRDLSYSGPGSRYGSIMFETAELGRKVFKKAFERAVPELRVQLLEMQQALRKADFPVIVLFSGVDGAGKGATVNLLNEWMDPRWIETYAYLKPSDEEQERPEFWRYWRDLPERGQFGLFLSAWYSPPFLDRVHDRITDADFDRRLDRIIAFERVLADDDALILKFWMHLGKAAQKRRLKALEKDPLRSWRVTETDWEHWRKYDRFVMAAEHTIRRTSFARAPWKIVEGLDPRYRSLTVATIIRDAVSDRLDGGVRAATAVDMEIGEQPPEAAVDTAIASLAPSLDRTVLTELDMDQFLSKGDYRRELPKEQGRLNALFRRARERGISVVAVFEGWDAGGKGGSIRRLTQALDARDSRVIAIAAPTDEERAHNYLWRFWRHIGRAGRVTIFDRSWYGRVLVERVEGFAAEPEWRRAYTEINEFERQLTEFGIVLVKFWLHITAEEQLRRFKERREIAYKRWKLTDDDWRNREKWELYERAVQEMVERTSTMDAPWTLVEGNCKRFARLKVLRTASAALEAALPKEKSQAKKKKNNKKS